MRIAGGTYTPRGKQLMVQYYPANNLTTVLDRQSVHSEVSRVLDGDAQLPFTQIPELDGILSALSKPGSTLTGEKLWDLRIALEGLEAAGKFIAGEGKELLTSFVKQFGSISRYKRELKELDNSLEPGGPVRDGATPTLANLRKRIGKQQEKLRTLAHSIAEKWHRDGIAQEPEPVFREGRHVVAVRSDSRGRADGAALDRSRSGQTIFIEPREVSEAGLELKELLRDEEQEVVKILARLTAICAERETDIDIDLDRLAQLDAAQAAMRFSGAGSMVLPSVSEKGTLHLKDARHPLLAVTIGPDRVVPLTLTLEDGQRTLVISGPNSGGKTVSLQTIGFCTSLALCGLPIPAGEESHIPFIDAIHVDIGDEQSLEDDLSTFTARLKRLKAMLKPSDAGKLCLIDEAGSGTDPAQGAALAISILDQLSDEKAYVVCATHDGRIKTHAAQSEKMINGRMIFSEKALEPTYEFRSGEPGRSFAFEIAERSGLSRDLVTRARELMGNAENELEDALRQAVRIRDKAESLLLQAEKDSRVAERNRMKYETLAGELENDAQKKRAAGAEEARDIVRHARSRIEGLVREIKETGASAAAIKKAQKEIMELNLSFDEAQVERNASGEDYHEGDEVYLLNLDRAAVVQSVGTNRLRVNAGSLMLDVAREDIRPASAGGSALHEREAARKKSAQVAPRGISTPFKSVPSRIELIGQKAEEARTTLEKYLDDVILAGHIEVSVIHGSGAGVLRRVVEDVLRHHISVEDFGLNTDEPGGTGVTRVRLKGGD